MSYNSGGGGSSGVGGSNPPWQRNSLGNSSTQGIPSLTSLPNPGLVGFPSNQNMYNQQSMGMGQQQQQSNMNMISGMGGNLNQMSNNQIYSTQNVQYPTRGLNPIAFPTASQQSGQGNNMNTVNAGGMGGGGGSGGGGHQNNMNYNKIGIVTKLQNDFGFVDEEIFFQKIVCKDAFPKLGDRVLVEATYSSNSPFKWNATRLQIVGANYQSGGSGAVNSGGGGGSGMVGMNRPQALAAVTSNMQQQQQQQQSHRGGSGYNAVPPPNEYAHLNRHRNMRNLSPKRRSPERGSGGGHRNNNSHHESRGGGGGGGNGGGGGSSSYREQDDEDRRRRREDREKERNLERLSRADKRDHSIDKREKISPVARRSSPKRKKQRVAPRYMVQIPKVSLTMTDADVLELTRRYSNLYIPSDFFFTNIRWSESFQPNTPYSIQKPCSFHIMHKCVEPVDDIDEIYDPSDANYLFSAKVMLMGIPPMAEVYSKCFAMAEDKEDDHRDFVHPTRLINFLVGVRGKNEAMAIGGPWSPSLDGPNPQNDPSVLIKTAIRTCRALTGIDLSNCTQWYRFVELYYHRSDAKYKGTLVPARVETVVIYLPDVRSCMPTRLEWDTLHSSYRQKLDETINQTNAAPSSFTTMTTSTDDTFVDGGAGDDASGDSSTAPANDTAISPKRKSKTSADAGASQQTVAAAVTDTNASKGGGSVDSVGGDDAIAADCSGGVSGNIDPDHEAGETDKDDENMEPTHFSKLEPKTMKVSDMRSELRARRLSSKGLKPQLVARLQKILKVEAADEAEEEEIAHELMEQEDQFGVDEPAEELDLMDVVVLDEYDSNKKETPTPVEDIKPMDEKERQQLERRYQLPEAPHIIVHPSRVARSGKFDCTVMSLSLLLDYRQEDTKEHSFEVSLFAELFNEMLMRDFGFNVYKALYGLPDKVKEDPKKGDDKKKSGAPDEDKSSSKDGTAASIDDGTVEKSEKDEKPRSKDEKDRGRDRGTHNKDLGDSKKRSRPEESEDDAFSIKSGDRRKKGEPAAVVKVKQFTANPELLLSFIYFDTTHCGYIFEKDLEELFSTLGLCLSRSQIRRTASKVTRDTVFYRKLTDKPKDESEKSEEPSALPEVDLSEIGNGNRIRVLSLQNSCTVSSKPKIAKIETGERSNGDVVPESISGMVTFKGSLIDITKMMEQLTRSEKAREDTEQLLLDLKKQHSELNASHGKATSKIKDLQSDVKSSNRKIGELEQSLSGTNKKNTEYLLALASINDKVAPFFLKSERSSSRNESNRDRERERDRRSRDRDDKDKEKERERQKDLDKEKEREKDDVKIEIKKEEK